MTRGPSRQQRVILDLLEGRERGEVYAHASGGLDTAELLEELLERDLLNDKAPRKQLMNTVVRSCNALLGRRLIEGTYVPDCDNPGRQTICWRAKKNRGVGK